MFTLHGCVLLHDVAVSRRDQTIVYAYCSRSALSFMICVHFVWLRLAGGVPPGSNHGVCLSLALFAVAPCVVFTLRVCVLLHDVAVSRRDQIIVCIYCLRSALSLRKLYSLCVVASC